MVRALLLSSDDLARLSIDDLTRSGPGTSGWAYITARNTQHPDRAGFASETIKRRGDLSTTEQGGQGRARLEHNEPQSWIYTSNLVGNTNCAATTILYIGNTRSNIGF